LATAALSVARWTDGCAAAAFANDYRKKAVQTATIVFALPFTLVIVVMAVALWRGVREDWDEEQRRDRALRRRMRDLVERPPRP
jgi:choline-glycine betaine transporter